MQHDLMRLLDGPVVFNLVIIFGCWLYYGHRSGWSDQPIRRGPVYRCGSCGNVYEGDRREPRSGCPRCGHFNDAVMR